MHDIGLGIKAGLAATAATYNQYIQVASMPAAVKPQAEVLCKQDVVLELFVTVLLTETFYIPPQRRTVFFAWSGFLSGRIV